MDAHYWWLYFSLLCSLLPAYLLVRAVLHILNINLHQRWRSMR